MQRIDSENVSETLPDLDEQGAVVGYFKNATVDQDGTTVSRDWLNTVQEELAKAITEKGITLTKSDLSQLAQSVTRMKVQVVDKEDYDVSTDDFVEVVRIATGASHRTVTLPSASDFKGRVLYFTKTDAEAGQVQFSAEIDGDENFALIEEGRGVAITSDGSQWVQLIVGGAGSNAQAGINYLSEANIETRFSSGLTMGWEIYKNTDLNADPEHDTPNTHDSELDGVTIDTVDDETALRGTSMRFQKPAEDRKGYGLRSDLFTIDQFYLNSNELTFRSMMRTIGIKETQTSVWIQRFDEDDIFQDQFKVDTNRTLFSGKYNHVSSWTAKDTRRYRLLIHWDTDTTDEHTLIMDQVSVGTVVSAIGVNDREELEIDLTGSGDFSAGKIKLVRNGKKVSIYSLEAMTHSSSASVASAPGLIPQRFRPENTSVYTYLQDDTTNYSGDVQTDGTLRARYLTWSGSGQSRTGSGSTFQVKYTISDANYEPAANILLAEGKRKKRFITLGLDSATTGQSSDFTLSWDRVIDSQGLDGLFDSGSPTKFTIPSWLDGKKAKMLARVNLSADSNSDTLERAQLVVRKNGNFTWSPESIQYRDEFFNESGSRGFSLEVNTAWITLNEGDEFDAHIASLDLTSTNTASTDTNNTTFQLELAEDGVELVEVAETPQLIGIKTKDVTEAPTFDGNMPANNILTGPMVAAGAIVEYGSNDDGHFIKYENGYMECFHRIALSDRYDNFSSSHQETTTWTFPASFTNENTHHVSMNLTGRFGTNVDRYFAKIRRDTTSSDPFTSSETSLTPDQAQSDFAMNTSTGSASLGIYLCFAKGFWK